MCGGTVPVLVLYTAGGTPSGSCIGGCMCIVVGGNGAVWRGMLPVPMLLTGPRPVCTIWMEGGFGEDVTS